MGYKRIYRDITLNGICATVLLPRSLRWRLLRFFGLDLEGWCAISPDCWFGGTNIAIGKGSTVNYGVFFDNAAHIRIGGECDIGMQVMFCTSTHEFGDDQRRAGPAGGKPIVVENGSWIGARAVILPGVTIGPGCIIAAGSVVNRDCERNGLYAGVPAKRVNDLDP